MHGPARGLANSECSEIQKIKPKNWIGFKAHVGKPTSLHELGQLPHLRALNLDIHLVDNITHNNNLKGVQANCFYV